MPDWAGLSEWLLPLAFVAAGAVLGWATEKLAVHRVRRLADRTEAVWDEVLVRSIRRAPTLLFTAAGAWAATQLLPLPDDVRRLLEKALMALVIFTFTLVAARATSEWLRRYARRTDTFLPASSLVTNISKLLVFLIGGLLILQNLDINITPIVGALGLSSLAVALALQPTLANAFAGFQIIATRQVRDGDYIRLESGEEGYVVDIKWRNTTIRALWDDHQIIVPNSKLSDSIVTNFSLPKRPLWLRMQVGVSYGSDLEQVERATLEVAREVWAEFSSPTEGMEPTLRFQEFGDSAVTFTVRILVDEFADQFQVRHEFVKRLQRRYAQEGIVIPWPIRTLHVPEALRLRQEAPPDAGPGVPPPPEPA